MATFSSIIDDSNNSNSSTNADQEFEMIGDAKTRKYNQIRECELRGSIWELREMALSRGGLVNAELRQRIWPILVGLSDEEPWLQETAKLFEPSDTPLNELEDRERDLIRRDVGRSVLFHHSCPSPNSVMAADEVSIESKAELSVAKLASVLIATTSTPFKPPTSTSTNDGGGGGDSNSNSNKTQAQQQQQEEDDNKPHYYQGMHDLGGVLLENLEYNEVYTAAILRRLCLTHLRDNCKATFEELKWFLNSVLMDVLLAVDPPVYQAIVESGLDALLPLTLVKWLFTWFTHSIHGEEEASRLVDAFIASHPLLPFYVSIAFLVHPRFRRDILTAEWDDPSSVNMAIQNLPSQIRSDWTGEETDTDPDHDNVNDGPPPPPPYSNHVTTQELIDTAISIMKQVPPKSLMLLVDDPDRASKMTLLKSLSSLDVTSPSASSHPCTRAKMASGVPFLLMQAQQQQNQHPFDLTWLRPFGPPPIIARPKATKTNKRSLATMKKRLKKRIRLFVRSLVQRLPRDRPNQFALGYAIFVAIYAFYTIFYDLHYLFFSSSSSSNYRDVSS